MPERLASFRGAVRCARARAVPGLTLSGNTAEAPGEPTALAFSGSAPADLPETLEDASSTSAGRSTASVRVRAAG
jgi:hypothetical protein